MQLQEAIAKVLSELDGTFATRDDSELHEAVELLRPMAKLDAAVDLPFNVVPREEDGKRHYIIHSGAIPHDYVRPELLHRLNSPTFRYGDFPLAEEARDEWRDNYGLRPLFRSFFSLTWGETPEAVAAHVAEDILRTFRFKTKGDRLFEESEGRPVQASDGGGKPFDLGGAYCPGYRPLVDPLGRMTDLVDAALLTWIFLVDRGVPFHAVGISRTGEVRIGVEGLPADCIENSLLIHPELRDYEETRRVTSWQDERVVEQPLIDLMAEDHPEALRVTELAAGDRVAVRESLLELSLAFSKPMMETYPDVFEASPFASDECLVVFRDLLPYQRKGFFREG